MYQSFLEMLPDELGDWIPESIATERCALAIKGKDGCLYAIIPQDDEENDTRDFIEFVMPGKYAFASHRREDIKKAVQIAYGRIEQIENCGWTFRVKCPKNWNSLSKTVDDGVRFCGTCSKHVHLCFKPEEVKLHASLDHCICFVCREHHEITGDVIILE